MLKRILFILLISLSLVAMSDSEVFKIIWGSKMKNPMDSSINRTLGFDQSYYYILGYVNDYTQIIKINKSLERVAQYTFSGNDKKTGRNYEYKASKYFNDKIYVFKTFSDNKVNSVELYVQEVDKNTMAEIGEAKKISELYYKKKSNKGFFSIVTSDDDPDAKLMIAIGAPREKEENEGYTIIMCDKEMNMSWSGMYEIPYPSDLFMRRHFSCDSRGNAYLLGKLYNEKIKDIRGRKQNFNHHILAYTENGKNTVDYEIKLEDKFINDLSYDITNDGDILAGGFYSKKGFYSVDGAFYFLMDSKSKNIKTSTSVEFGIDIITQGMSEKQETKTRKEAEQGFDPELLEYDLHNMIKGKDGSIILIGEQFYINNYAIPGITEPDYHYNNIIVIKIDKTGKIEWSTTIPKKQVSYSDHGYYSSFTLAVTGEKLRFIYNDNIQNLSLENGHLKNFTLPNNKDMTYAIRNKDGIVVMATIDKDGKLDRKELISNADLNVDIRPKVCQQINDSEVLLFGERGRSDQFAILKFE